MTVVDLPKKKYSIIYADPPWFYPARNNTNTAFGKGASSHYSMMKTPDICALPIKNITADNCALLMWTTMPHLEDSLEVLNAWSFTYRTTAFVWVKTTKDGKYRSNPGYYTCSNAEICLLGVKGKMPPQNRTIKQIVSEPITIHSKKPERIRDDIVKLFGDLPRIELFARQKTDGWDCWGNETEKYKKAV